jgi:hypothetical protein
MPATSLEGKGGAGNQFCHFSAAFGTFFQRVIGKLPAQLKMVAAGITLIFINWHW